VAFTYNDPVIWAEYAMETARACQRLGLRSVAVTAGYIGAEARADFFPLMNAANVDLKSFSEAFYRDLCGAALTPVLETLRWIKRETECWLEITTLLIPGRNDSEEELRQLSAWIATELGPEVPLHLSAFHPDFKLRQLPRTSLQSLRVARRWAQEEGLLYVYTGNLYNPEGDRTSCPSCKTTLIQRDRYRLLEWGLDNGGCCRRCGYRLDGHFGEGPGERALPGR